jgi:hypothetical protein
LDRPERTCDLNDDAAAITSHSSNSAQTANTTEAGALITGRATSSTCPSTASCATICGDTTQYGAGDRRNRQLASISSGAASAAQPADSALDCNAGGSATTPTRTSLNSRILTTIDGVCTATNGLAGGHGYGPSDTGSGVRAAQAAQACRPVCTISALAPCATIAGQGATDCIDIIGIDRAAATLCSDRNRATCAHFTGSTARSPNCRLKAGDSGSIKSARILSGSTDSSISPSVGCDGGDSYIPRVTVANGYFAAVTGRATRSALAAGRLQAGHATIGRGRNGDSATAGRYARGSRYSTLVIGYCHRTARSSNGTQSTIAADAAHICASAACTAYTAHARVGSAIGSARSIDDQNTCVACNRYFATSAGCTSVSTIATSSALTTDNSRRIGIARTACHTSTTAAGVLRAIRLEAVYHH